MHPVLSWSAVLSHYNTSLKYLQVYCIINLKHVHFRWLTLNAINKILRIKGIHVFSTKWTQGSNRKELNIIAE